MNTTRKQPALTVARREHEAARLAFETARYQRGAKIMAGYDAVDGSRQRRQPIREFKTEAGIYDMTKRLLGCNLGRDLERNYSPAKAMMLQFRVNVVGSLGKLRINADGADEATAWFNEVWAKDCDYRDDLDWSTLLQNILAAEIRDGDVLAIVDDQLTDSDTGKVMTWESDQIVPVSEKVLADSPYAKTKQDSGILRDNDGRIVAYCVTGRRGLSVIDDPKEVTYWTRDQARLMRNPWRLNQGRGIPSLITPSTNFVDLYEILSSALASAKKAVKQYAFVKRDNAVTDWDSPTTGSEWLPENDGRVAADVAKDGANQTTHTSRNYEKLEALTGGLTDYLDPHDVVEIPEMNHPNPELAPFLEAVHDYSGAALGLAHAYTALRADTSYTAFRGDMIMSWVTFYWLQKHLERMAADWLAIRALRWAQRKGEFKVQLPAGWERTLTWSWPTMPAVDEGKESVAQAQFLKNGTLDFADILGPNWQTKFQAMADQLAVARKLKLPLSVFEQKSGGMATATDKKDGADTDKGDDE